MMRALSRLVVRVAIVAASLAWASFVFANTVGDPGRGEQIAAAVLADDDARAEVAAPIASAVTRTAGFPPERQPAVAAQVDALLRDPATARTFIDPFAGRWARMLGEDDVRPTGYDVRPVLDEIIAATPGVGAYQGASADDSNAVIAPADDAVLATGVPLPQARLGWLLPSRGTMAQVTLMLALAAVAGFAVAFAIGDPRWVLRRLGAWATFAGASWVILPMLVVWAARQWVTGADSVVAVGTEVALSGLRPTAVVLLVGGAIAFALSFSAVPGWAIAPSDGTATAAAPSQAERRRRGRNDPVGGGPHAGHPVAAVVGAATSGRAAPSRVAATAEMPIVDRPTGELPTTVIDDGASPHGGEHDDPLWNFYR